MVANYFIISSAKAGSMKIVADSTLRNYFALWNIYTFSTLSIET